jgi:hypothetical protein
MPPEPTDAPAEVCVVSRLLHPPEAGTLAELQALITDFSDERVGKAVAALTLRRIIEADDDGRLCLSEPAQYLDALGVVCV